MSTSIVTDSTHTSHIYLLLHICINDIQLVANESMTAVGTCEKAIDRCSIVSMSIVTSSTLLLHTYILCVDANFGVARHVK